jgi:hypothetical protein
MTPEGEQRDGEGIMEMWRVDGADFAFEGFWGATIEYAGSPYPVVVQGFNDGVLVGTYTGTVTDVGGFVATPFTAVDRVTWDVPAHTSGFDKFFMDDVVVSEPTTPTPEPASLLLFGVGAATTLIARRRNNGSRTGTTIR